MKNKILNMFVIIFLCFFFCTLKILAYYESFDSEEASITTTSYENLTFRFDKNLYGNNIPIKLTVTNPNLYPVIYTFSFSDTSATYKVDGSNVTNYTVSAVGSKSHSILVTGTSNLSIVITIKVKSPYSKNYTKTIDLDVSAPVGTITSTNNQSSSQNVSLNMTDNIGVVSYYFGTNSNPGISDYIGITPTSLAVINKTVSNNGTYYLFVKDVAGNIYNTSIDFYKVVLETDGGSVSQTSIVAKSGSEISLPIPVATGKDFISWNTASDGSGSSYITSYTGNDNRSITLYAMWKDKKTLYSVLATEATNGSGLAQKYTGIHQDSFAGIGTSDIYYYNATNSSNATSISSKNNVLFAGFCWQMLRTTDTGGVKLIYNGKAVDGKCTNTNSILENVQFNEEQDLPSYAGYMYNSTYSSQFMLMLDLEWTNMNLCFH